MLRQDDPVIPGRWRMTVLSAIALASVSCGTSSPAASSVSRFRDAVLATATAQSFTATWKSVEATYQAPDRVLQLEHGVGSSAKSQSVGTVTSSPSPTYPTTLTKIFVGDKYYESDTVEGHSDPFSVTTRCGRDDNAGEFIIDLLREIAAHGRLTGAGDTFTFQLPHQNGSALPSTGTVTINGGYVSRITIPTKPVPAPTTWTITSINSAPPVTAPVSASPMTMTC